VLDPVAESTVNRVAGPPSHETDVSWSPAGSAGGAAYTGEATATKAAVAMATAMALRMVFIDLFHEVLQGFL